MTDTLCKNPGCCCRVEPGSDTCKHCFVPVDPALIRAKKLAESEVEDDD